MKKINLTDKQKKILNLFALIFASASVLGAGIWFIVYNVVVKTNSEFTPQIFITYLITYGGLILLVWKIILLLIHTKKVKQFGQEERLFMALKNKKEPTPKKQNFKSHGFEFVENKKEVLIKINRDFNSQEIFLTSFKAATMEYCEKIRKDMEV